MILDGPYKMRRMEGRKHTDEVVNKKTAIHGRSASHLQDKTSAKQNTILVRNI
jgi:hypothetical protein